MDAPAEESIGSVVTTMIDETYEFLAPRWFDFINGETEDESRRAELWFQSALSCAPSPSVPKIKARRSFKVETMCNFNEEDEEIPLKAKEPVAATISSQSQPSESKKELITPTVATTVKPSHDTFKDEEKIDNKTTTDSSHDHSNAKTEQTQDKENIPPACTPKPPMHFSKGGKSMDLKKQQTARKIASLLKNPSALRPKNQLQLSQPKGSHQKSVKRETSVRNIVSTTNLIQENQAIKRQKLDDGKSRQILNPKPTTLLHKTREGLVNTGFNVCPSVTKHTPKENRKVYVREQIAPFVSTAELMKKFQTSTRGLSLPHANTSVPQNRPKLTLTRPKEPEFVTSQRARPLRVKSSAELEEEMLAKIPKFKARPVNKKILAAPALPAPQRSTPHLPEFQEFHLQTMARANHHAESSSVASTEVSKQTQHNDWRPHLTEPKCPVLQTMLRARPTKAKTTAELEQEELEKAPKFKAKSLNKKIFESKGEMGIFCNTKKHITIPQEFHFATDERISRPDSVLDIFDKLSLNSESFHEKPLPRNTAPNPFNLRTEERGAEKEKKFFMELVHKKIGDEKARVPKANPYPYTTDYPVVPPKPEPKQCTQPEPFQLESLVRHEEELRREMEERKRMEREEAQKRLFKAQPVIKEDPIPVPEKVRMPLTEIQEFNLHVEHRAVERADFDHKIKEKENQYKRYREESEAAKMVEEERALKQMRKTMVPHARPVPNFNKPFLPQKSNKGTTKPKSPNLRVIKRTERRTMMARPTVSAATSASAGQMR
ncbi:PREDICTED: protein TPX2-like [Camelina sativa]|uniref:Protein TPX2-like n=1 Tax=Camelina sativa TaxID=90675 RepID=A0ABM0X934_CAMSA|nr:PREDICTED: protein TPX2-like [Camelina sativa]